MASFEDEREKAAREEEELLAAPRSGNRPLLLAAFGLALMVGGYLATNYVPVSQRQAEMQRIRELQVLAKQRKDAGIDDGLSERLDQAAPPWREPPYQMVGRLAIYFGLFLFVLAGVLMYRSSPPPKMDDDLT